MDSIDYGEVVGGYTLGFGLLVLVQVAIVLAFAIGVIGFPNEGSLFLVAAITVSMAVVSLTLGMAISGLAKSPFQVIQLLIIFVLPQVLLSGIFDLSQAAGWLQELAAIFPVGYGAEALRDVMLRSAGLDSVTMPLAILWAFAAVFFTLACAGMGKAKARIGRD